MTEDRNGKVVTFYSFKGGTGRTMALANVAWILASAGQRVLVVDWDLESPGLHRFFSPFIEPAKLRSTGGVIDLIREYESAATPEPPEDPAAYEYYARVQRHAFSVSWPHFPAGATLDFLSAGKQNTDYGAALAGMNWDSFYEKQGGGLFLDALRADMKRRYDYVLIDSRTGLSDVASICTIHLPDILVDCFTFSEQGIDGAAEVAHLVQGRRDVNRDIRILPVPMRVDPAEKAKADAGRETAKLRFTGLPADMDDESRDLYWVATQVPYQAFYAYEETLATFGDKHGQTGSLLSAYEALTSHITEREVRALPVMDESRRTDVVARFQRPMVVAEADVTLKYAPEDEVWAEWIERVLAVAGVRVNGLDSTPSERGPGRQVTIVSNANRKDEEVTSSADRSGRRLPLDLYVDDVRPLSRFAASSSAFVATLNEDVAIDRTLRLVGRTGAKTDVLEAVRPRFPGSGPTVFNAPARNPRFTGRANDLRELRSQLQSGSTVVISGAQPVALRGMGGIGKTQVAMEYAHRFRGAYDVVWWIAADPVTFIDVQLDDLRKLLNLPAVSTSPENARAVVQALGRGEPYRRWLLIFDNAEDPDQIRQFIPQGAGHVLITSRNPDWGNQATSVEVNIFNRGESVDHFLERVAGMTAGDANQVAEVLGDLPIAIAAAAAWLADTKMPVPDYLREIDRHGVRAISGDAPLPDPASNGAPPESTTPVEVTSKSVEATWDLSLDLLRRRSPAAFRLLQLCSVLAPEIAMELVYSDELAAALVPYDPTVSEPLVRGSLVQQINRLALLKVDMRGERGEGQERSKGGQIQVHRLLQSVVRSRMSDRELDTARHQVHVMLAASRPDGEVDDPEMWPRFRTLWSHLEISDAVHCDDEAVRRLLIDRVRYLFFRGDLDRALDRAELYNRTWSERLAEMEASDSSPAATLAAQTLRRQLLHLRFNFANVLRDLGYFERAREMDSGVLAEQEELLGSHHPHTLMTAGGLAGDLRGLGLYADALARDEDTWAAWSESFGDDHPRTLAALSNLAVSFRLTGDFRQALERDEIAFAVRRKVLGETHFNTLASAGNIGRDLREAGEYERSVTQLENVAKTFADVWKEESRGAINARANLAVSLRSAGRAERAIPIMDDVYYRLSETLGPDNPDTLASRLSRAVNFLAVEDVRAEEELEAVHNKYRDQLGPRHPHTLVCVNNLAMAARANERSQQARVWAAEAAADLASVLGENHPYTLAAQTNLAVCAAEGGHLSEASTVIGDAVARVTTVLGPEHPDSLRCLANAALIHLKLGDESQEFVVNSLIDRLAARIGDRHPAVSALRDRRFLHRVIDPHPF